MFKRLHLLFLSSFCAVIVFHGIHANDGELYVHSNRKGCVPVKSREPCPASKLDGVNTMNYDNHIGETQSLMKDAVAANGNNSDCTTALKIALCSTFIPKCFEDGSKDYGSGNASCWKANATCQYPVIHNFEKFCKTLPVGKQPLPKCILPTESIDGACPQPEYKMPDDILRSYERRSKHNKDYQVFRTLEFARYPNNTKTPSLNGTLIFSKSCVLKLKEIACWQVYCSSDKERILTKHNWKSCKTVVESCFDTVINNLQPEHQKDLRSEKKAYMGRCQRYPNTTITELPTGAASCYYKQLYYYLCMAVISLIILV